METGCFIPFSVGTVPPLCFLGRILIYVSSGGAHGIYQACAYLHVQTCMQACMDTDICVSSFCIYDMAAWGLDHRSQLCCVTRRKERCKFPPNG